MAKNKGPDSQYITLKEFSYHEIFGWHRYPARKGGPSQLVVKVGTQNISLNMNGLRILCFEQNPQCICCGVVGTIVKIQKHKVVASNKWHVNLYGVSPDGTQVIMTVDHILPKARGGEDKLDNLQTMCMRCNQRKGARLDVNYAILKKQTVGQYLPRRSRQPKAGTIGVDVHCDNNERDADPGHYSDADLREFSSRQQNLRLAQRQDCFFKEPRWATVGAILSTFARNEFA